MFQKTTLFSTLPIIRHSFATPVTNILLNAHIAAENLSGHSSTLYLRRVVLNATYLQSALRLADNPVAAQQFSPKTALQELISLNEGTDVHHSLVSRMFIPIACQLEGNKLAFQETISCLLNNAYESYAPDHIHKLVFLSARQENDRIALQVTDGGRGMTWLAKTLSTAQAYSSKSRHTGLGLYFAKRTVEREFGGRLLIASKPGRGTTITALFPTPH